MKKYASYKPSSIPWIPEIPEHWNIRRAKHIFKVIDDKTAKGDEELLSVSEHHGVIPRRNAVVNTFKAESYEGYKLCKKRDLVINSLWAWSKGLGVSEYEGIISNAYSVYRFKVDADHRYFNYLLRTKGYVGEYFIRSKGIWISRLQLHDQEFLDISMILPPVEEQTAIANYLDAKTEQLNTFITKKQKLIDLLKEQKQAIINELLQDNEGKWKKRKLKFSVTKVGAGVTPSGGATVYKDSGIPLLRSQNIYNDRLVLEDVAFITQEIHDSMSGSKVRAGDVLLNITGGSLGRCFYATEELGEANVNQHVSIIRPHKKKIETQFLQLLLISELGNKQIWEEQTGSGREGLTAQAIKNFKFPIPNLSDQKILTQSVKSETLKVDTAISRIEKEIEMVKELKQSLVAEVVTGKIKVTN